MNGIEKVKGKSPDGIKFLLLFHIIRVQIKQLKVQKIYYNKLAKIEIINISGRVFINFACQARYVSFVL